MTSAPKPHSVLPAADLVRGIKLTDEAQAKLRPGVSAEVYFDDLTKSGLHADAIRVLSRLLAPRSGVWWGCLCAWEAMAPRKRELDEAAIAAVVMWLKDPTDENRRAAGAAAKSAGRTTAAGLVGSAAYYSEGSIATPGKTEVPTKPEFTPKLVASAVLTAARSGGASQTTPRMRQYLVIGTEVYRGKNTWVTKK